MNLEDADVLLQRVATIAIMYYPRLPADAPEYKLIDDIDWCLNETAKAEATDELRRLIGRAIVDPTAHREALTARVYALVPDTGDAE